MKKQIQSLVLAYLRFFAKKALKRHQPTIIGIAGSVGKSSTRNAIEAILKDHFPTKCVGNSETGIPLGVLGMKPTDYSVSNWLTMLIKAPLNTNFLKGTQYLIAEMGIDEPDPPKNMDYLLTILKPDIAVSLNVSATHSMQFDKTVTANNLTYEDRLKEVIKNIALEDIKIITQSNCKVGIYNADDLNIANQIESRNLEAKILTFGADKVSDITYTGYQVSLKGTSFDFSVRQDGRHQKLNLNFTSYILPLEYREGFASAILVALQTGLSLKQIKIAIEANYQTPKSRSSLFRGINDSVIIDSTYNASKASTLAFLNLISILKKETKRPVTFLFGDMRELGDESRIEHEAVAQKVIGIVDHLYLVGPLTREFVLPIIQKKEEELKEVRWFDNSYRAGEYLRDNLAPNTILLAKGSQNTIFLEEAVKQILEDKKDEKNLCRQDNYWEKIKSNRK